VASFYSVVQYVPDPVADERVNVGVVAFGDGMIVSQFVHSWSRIEAFSSGQNISFLREFAEKVSTWASPQVEIPGIEHSLQVSPEEFRRMAGTWINAIQFTEPKASLLSPQEALKAGLRYLREPVIKRRTFRDRRAAVGLAFRELHDAMLKRAGEPGGKAVEKNFKVKGNLDEHRFDVAVHNGQPLVAAHCISFEGPTTREATRELEKEIDAAAWSIDDVKGVYPSLRLGVVTLGPRTKSKTYDRAVHVFEGLHATVVTESEVPDWAVTTSAQVAGAIGGH
jgi:Protein of unknown function (DUF3037)